MIQEKEKVRCLFFFSVVFLFAVISSNAQSPEACFGTWTLNYDGWTTTLVLKSNNAGGVTGTYFNVDKNKNQKLLDVRLSQYAIHFVADWDDSGSVNEADAIFDGRLFYRDTRYMAGLSSGANQKAWFATKIGRVPDREYPAPSSTWMETPVIAGTVKVAYSMNEDVTIEFYNDKPEPVDMTQSYFIVQYQSGDSFKEFYTSEVNPFKTDTIVSHGGKICLWNQWDNEHKAKAKAGIWRVKFYVPGLKNSPFIKTFEIYKLKEL